MNKITLEEALDRIRQNTPLLPAVEMQLEDINGETAAEDLSAPQDQPPFPRSPLDGYAFRSADSADASPENPAVLRVIGKVCAGDEEHYRVEKGEAVRIMTGARIPEGADAVVMQEKTDLGKSKVRIFQELKPFQNYCFQGEDYRAGTVLVRKGTTLAHSPVTLLASAGISGALVYRKPFIAVLTTGSELISPGAKLGNGKIYNANLYFMRARMRELGIPFTVKQVPDQRETVKKEILAALEYADAVITTGGVSVGEKDILNEVLPALHADILFDGIAMKPGSPAKFSLISGKPVLSLSGNPFAAAATFEILGRAMIGAGMGTDSFECTRESAVLVNAFGKRSPHRRFACGLLENGRVSIPDCQSSGQVVTLISSNRLIDIPAGCDRIPEGAAVTVWKV